MEITRNIIDIRRLVHSAKSAGRSVGFVPTLGALHAGHLSLIARARQETDFLVVSIFLNPTQFGPDEDLDKYPCRQEQDLALCREQAVDAVFLPTAEQMYPPGHTTVVRVLGLSEKLCGLTRPDHFPGVTTVVAKLFNIVQPDIGYFGQKDAQQTLIIRQMVRDLDIPVCIRICPTVRENDGLALSSRNAYLTPQQRAQAACLYRALQQARDLIVAGQKDPDKIIAAMHDLITQAGPCTIDYLAAVDPQTLEPASRDTPTWLLALAVRIGQTRLIDNILVDIPPDK